VIVVTGASGFIGSNLVKELNRRGTHQVVAVDDYPWLRNVCQLAASTAQVRYSDQMIVAGCVDKERLVDWLDRDGSAVTGIVHLGACSDTTVSDREYVMANNYAYSQSLWQWCVRARRPLVYASSAATYGDGRLGYDDRCHPSRYRPLNLYGESKHLFDLWALDQAKTPPRWAGLKYFNVYGPNESHKGRMASVVYHGFQQIQETGAIRLFKSHKNEIADGDQQRDFVYVADVVAATLHFLDPQVRAGSGLYNVGVGQARRFNDLAHAIFSALGRAPRIVYYPMPQDLQGRYQYFTQAVIGKLRSAGFLNSMTSLETGVCDYVQNHLRHQAIAA
jgi:ADP-L-glycero-D-manno-heptose 6-epimerase